MSYSGQTYSCFIRKTVILCFSIWNFLILPPKTIDDIVDLSCLGDHSASKTLIAGNVKPPPFNQKQKSIYKQNSWILYGENIFG